MPTKSPNSKVEAKNSGEVGKSGVAEERRRERKEGRRGGGRILREEKKTERALEIIRQERKMESCSIPQ